LERHYLGLTANRAQGSDSRQIRSRHHEDLLDVERLVVSGFEVREYSAAASLASATLDRPPRSPRRIEHLSPMDRTGEAGAAPAARMVCRVATSRRRSVDSIHVRKPLRPLSHGGGDCQEVVM
jgi:hypothetical protein